jgi:hypothetical protein
MAKAKKLAMVPAKSDLAVGFFTPAGESALKGLRKVSRPPLIKPDSIPVGALVSGEILELSPSFSKKKNMENSKLIKMRHANGSEFFFPLTGVIKNSLGGESGVTENIGKTLHLVRLADGKAANYGGNKMFQFDVYLSE